ncbi:hypothetical protein E1B28_006205 [Marasmius oreades]|uniref:Uncharacterized protein n=1 Tax=Marasmius oreades TaxID=181124 RepID=A0A9P7UVK9_9AGAR|nr:uncharacterized protein E1B28_006205 [Marasmius oreades]KAG7095465.1 hypothetical protein E1B28_006205 [Marasmius oreades]
MNTSTSESCVYWSSLQATWIRNTILRALRDFAYLDSRPVTNSFVYDHPTINRLSTFVFSLATGGMIPEQLDESSKKPIMAGYVNRSSRNLSARQHRLNPTPKGKTGKVVLVVTGSTGKSRVLLLHSMVNDPTVAALIRRGAADISQRRRKVLEDRSLDAKAILSGNFLGCDLSQDQLELERFGVQYGATLI